jgi:hypothetical protein
MTLNAVRSRFRGLVDQSRSAPHPRPENKGVALSQPLLRSDIGERAGNHVFGASAAIDVGVNAQVANPMLAAAAASEQSSGLERAMPARHSDEPIPSVAKRTLDWSAMSWNAWPEPAFLEDAKGGVRHSQAVIAALSPAAQEEAASIETSETLRPFAISPRTPQLDGPVWNPMRDDGAAHFGVVTMGAPRVDNSGSIAEAQVLITSADDRYSVGGGVSIGHARIADIGVSEPGRLRHSGKLPDASQGLGDDAEPSGAKWNDVISRLRQRTLAQSLGPSAPAPVPSRQVLQIVEAMAGFRRSGAASLDDAASIRPTGGRRGEWLAVNTRSALS